MSVKAEDAFTLGMIGLVFIAGSFVTSTALGINCPALLPECMFVIGFFIVCGVGLYLGCKHLIVVS